MDTFSGVGFNDTIGDVHLENTVLWINFELKIKIEKRVINKFHRG